MASRTTLVDDEERAPSDGDAEGDSMLDTQETARAKAASEAAARPSARALYVPSALPMVELKQQLARELAEEEASRSPTQRPPPPAAPPDVALHPLPPPPAPMEPAPPPPGLEKAIAQRFASVVDTQEANAKWTFPVVQNPVGLQPAFEPIVQPAVEPTVEPIAPPKPHVRKLRIALFALMIGLVGTALGILHGDLTKTDAQNAMSILRGAALNVVARVQRL